MVTGRALARVLREHAATGRIPDVDGRARRGERWGDAGSRARAVGVRLAWRPDGSEVAYAWLDGASFGLVATRTDGGGSRPLTPVAFGAPDIAWSPDGSTIAYTDVIRTLYAVPAAGGTPRKLADGAAFDPAFSPDGTRVAFAVYRGVAGSGSQLATVPTDGSDERMLTSNGAANRYPTWSPDGTQLLEARTLAGSAAVVAVAADGSGERIVRQEAQARTRSSRSGGRAAPRSCTSPGCSTTTASCTRSGLTAAVCGSSRTTTRTTRTRPSRRPAGGSRSTGRRSTSCACTRPTCTSCDRTGSCCAGCPKTPKSRRRLRHGRRTGRRLAFVRTGSEGITRLVVLDLARRTQRTITPRETALAQPSWSSDGRWIAFTAYHQGLAVDAVRPDGRSRRTIVPATVDSHGVGHGGSAPAWAPRGGRLAYLAGLNTFREIYTWSLAVRAANGSRRVLAHDLHGDRPAWSPDGRTLAYSTGSDLWSVPAGGGAAEAPPARTGSQRRAVVAAAPLRRARVRNNWREKSSRIGSGPRTAPS